MTKEQVTKELDQLYETRLRWNSVVRGYLNAVHGHEGDTPVNEGTDPDLIADMICERLEAHEKEQAWRMKLQTEATELRAELIKERDKNNRRESLLNYACALVNSFDNFREALKYPL